MNLESSKRRPKKRPLALSKNLWRTTTICGLLLLAVWLVFGQTAQHGFVNMDDDEYIYQNRHLFGGLTADDAIWAIRSSYSANWHPLTWMSHMLDWQLYGASAGGHHLTNVLLHAGTAMLLFLVLWPMTPRFGGAPGGSHLCRLSTTCGVGGVGNGTQGRS